MKGAAAGLTGSNYLWIVTQSVVGDPKVNGMDYILYRSLITYRV